MKEPALFDRMSPMADPDPLPFSGNTIASRNTSKAAAKGAAGKAQTMRELVYEYFKRASWGLTDEELIEQSGLHPNTARPRRIELVRAGRLRDSGVTRTRFDLRGKPGRSAVVWEAVREPR